MRTLLSELKGATPVIWRPRTIFYPPDCGGAEFDEVEYEAHCPECDRAFESISTYSFCPYCGTKIWLKCSAPIIRGNEDKDEDQPEANIVPENIAKVTFKQESRADAIRLNAPIYATRKVLALDNEIGVGDQIAVGHYTATCQKVSKEGALFFMDQYDDDPQRMNDKDTNEGGYEKSGLRQRINSKESLKDFPEDIRSRMVPFENGDMVRIPAVSELFGHEECEDWCEDWCEDDGAEQLPLMKLRENRTACRRNECEWGWLQNKVTASAAGFVGVTHHGYARYYCASAVLGVRRVFLIK